MPDLSTLNDAQRRAVEHITGPMMIVAGPGSGKTRVLTFRIAHLIEQGVKPWNILSLTFTNKAAREMRERIEKQIGDSARNLHAGTFHSVFARILRYEATALDFSSNFTIYDTDDSRSLIKAIVKDLGLNKDSYKPAATHGRISLMKNNFINPTKYMQDAEFQHEDSKAGRGRLGEVYKLYVERCRAADAMDFDDILVLTYELFDKNPNLLQKYQDKYQYILVDEYQDTNEIQYRIIKQLASRDRNICVVGDDAQSIYAFRGANINNILNFETDYPDLQVFKLEQNYRSTQTIVNAASSIIGRNRRQLDKKLWTANDLGSRIKVYKAISDKEEATFVSQSIFETKMQYHAADSEFAILYRTNAQSRVFEEALRKRNIPHRIIGGMSFYQRKEVKDLLSYFRLALNPKDDEALKRIINFPARGIGKTSLDKLTGYAAQIGEPVLFAAHQAEKFLNGRSAKAVKAFAEMTARFEDLVNDHELDAYETALTIARESGVLRHYGSDKSIEGINRYENLQEVMSAISEFANNTEHEDRSLAAYMQDVALLTDEDRNTESDDAVKLMTIHAAKGLEFSYVYIVGLEENLFPSQMSMDSPEDIEEERRLFYVAVTRAKERLVFSFATSRFRWGTLQYCEESRFIKEVDPQLLDQSVGREAQEAYTPFSVMDDGPSRSGGAKSLKPKPTRSERVMPERSAGFRGDDTTGLRPGMKVEHSRFGRGKVLQIDGGGGNRKATIQFAEHGQKLILLKYAKLKIVD